MNGCKRRNKSKDTFQRVEHSVARVECPPARPELRNVQGVSETPYTIHFNGTRLGSFPWQRKEKGGKWTHPS